MRIKLGAAVLIAAALGGCATSLNLVGDPFMSPAKFRFLRCEDITKRMAAAQARDQELRALMERADTGVGGTAVNVMVYGPDLKMVESELRELNETWGEKRCADEAVKAPPKPGVAPPRH